MNIVIFVNINYLQDFYVEPLCKRQGFFCAEPLCKRQDSGVAVKKSSAAPSHALCHMLIIIQCM